MSKDFKDVMKGLQDSIFKKRVANIELSDNDLELAVGGIGGANEATCPKCGAPMTKVHNDYGDDYWTCKTCNVDQLVSDAEFIELVRELERMGYGSQIEYPIWWNKI